jgi:RPA family protein
MTFSGKRRAPAIKLKIKDIIEGEFETTQDGTKLLHVKTDDLVRRVRIMGEITSRTVIESDESVIFEIDDTSGSLKVKGGGSEWAGQIFLDMKDLKEGTIVDVVGLVNEAGDGKAFINCEMCLPVTDDAIKVLRELEISKYYKRKGLDSKATDSIESAIKDQEKLVESDEIKTQIIDLLKNDEHIEEGCTFDEIKRALGLTTKELEPELRALQNDGDIFEPMPGTFKYV